MHFKRYRKGAWGFPQNWENQEGKLQGSPSLIFLNFANGYPFATLAGRKSGADAWSENARDFERKRIKNNAETRK